MTGDSKAPFTLRPEDQTLVRLRNLRACHATRSLWKNARRQSRCRMTSADTLVMFSGSLDGTLCAGGPLREYAEEIIAHCFRKAARVV